MDQITISVNGETYQLSFSQNSSNNGLDPLEQFDSVAKQARAALATTLELTVPAAAAVEAE